MARPRKSPETSKELAKPRGFTQPAYSPQVGGNKYVVYVSYHPPQDQYPRVLVQSFLGTFAAKWFIERLVNKSEHTTQAWKYGAGYDVMTTDMGIDIRVLADQLQEILSYQPTEEEALWSDNACLQSLLQLKYGRGEETNDNEDEPEREEGEPKPVVLKQKNAKTREAKPPKEPKVKIDKSGKVTAGELAAELKMKPSDFRAVLRKLKMVKPSGGWLFDKADADKIKKQVKENIK